MDSTDYNSLTQELASETPGSMAGRITESLKDPQNIAKHFLEDTSAFLLQDKLKDGLVSVARGGVLKKLGLSDETVAKASEAVKSGVSGVKKVARDALESAKSKLKSTVQSKGTEFSDRFSNASTEIGDEIPLPRAPPAVYDPQAATGRVLQSGASVPEQDQADLKQEIDDSQQQGDEADKEEEEDADKGDDVADKVEKDLKKGEEDVGKDGEEDPEMSIPLAVGLGVASLVTSFFIKPEKQKIAPVGMLNYSITSGS